MKILKSDFYYVINVVFQGSVFSEGLKNNFTKVIDKCKILSREETLRIFLRKCDCP